MDSDQTAHRFGRKRYETAPVDIDEDTLQKVAQLTGGQYYRADNPERFQSIYSNVRAREDAENRAASTVADDLKTRLAAYLSGAA